MSPYSIINSLALCYFASENETSKQIKDFLNLNDFSINEIRDIFGKRLAKKPKSKANGMKVLTYKCTTYLRWHWVCLRCLKDKTILRHHTPPVGWAQIDRSAQYRYMDTKGTGKD